MPSIEWLGGSKKSLKKRIDSEVKLNHEKLIFVCVNSIYLLVTIARGVTTGYIIYYRVTCVQVHL